MTPHQKAKERAREKIVELDVICKQADQYQENAGYPVDVPSIILLEKKLDQILDQYDTAMIAVIEGIDFYDWNSQTKKMIKDKILTKIDNI